MRNKKYQIHKLEIKMNNKDQRGNTQNNTKMTLNNKTKSLGFVKIHRHNKIFLY